MIMMTLDVELELLWGGYAGISRIVGGEDDLSSILAVVLGAFNICLSLFYATTIIKCRSEKNYDMLLACVFTTGCVNLLAAYLWRSIASDTWFGWTFTATLMLDSVLNLTTAVRILTVYRMSATDILPQYMPVAQAEDSRAWPNEKLAEKSCGV